MRAGGGGQLFVFFLRGGQYWSKEILPPGLAWFFLYVFGGIAHCICIPGVIHAVLPSVFGTHDAEYMWYIPTRPLFEFCFPSVVFWLFLTQRWSCTKKAAMFVRWGCMYDITILFFPCEL